jgi:hypothetical protein
MLDIDPKQFEKCPNFHRYELSEEQIIIIAKKAVEAARNDFYKEVGETIVTKFFWLVGIAAVGLVAWLQTHNIIKL